MQSFNFSDWIELNIDPVIQDAFNIIETAEESSQAHQAVKGYWQAFAQNSINLTRMMSNSPHCFPQIIMAFRLLQETSADIFYLKNNRENIAHIIELSDEIKEIVESRTESLRIMANTIAKTDIRSDSKIKLKEDGTQDRIDNASRFLEKSLGSGLTVDLKDINKLLNGYSHFNPAAIYWQNGLTDYGYMEIYTRLLHFYPAWLYLVLVSMSELLGIESLNEKNSKRIIEGLLERIEESGKWQEVEFVPIDQKSTEERADNR